MVIILLYQDVLLASASWYAVDFESVSVALCNEYLSLPKKKKKRGRGKKKEISRGNYFTGSSLNLCCAAENSHSCTCSNKVHF